MKLNHYIGGILLVSGTSIGAGMLAIPISTGFMGFFPSLGLFAICWLFFLITAIFFIDVNDSIKVESNLITMAKRTLGRGGEIYTWIVYLLLLYSLTAAYIAGSAPLFQEAFRCLFDIEVPLKICNLAFPVIFGFFVYLGTVSVDFLNRLLMLGLVVTYFILIAFVPSHIQTSFLTHVDFSAGVIALPIVVTSFGYHIILPTLGTYLKHDRKHLILCVIFGSCITLFVYICWQLIVLGIVPLKGSISIANTWFSGEGTAAKPLAQLLNNPTIALTAHFFSFFAIITSFLGVSLSLADFVTDGFNLKNSRQHRFLAVVMTFVPPLIFVMVYPKGFMLALDYAGAFVVLLLGLLPAAMAWNIKEIPFYQTLKGRSLIIAIGLISVGVVTLDILLQKGLFEHFLQIYRG